MVISNNPTTTKKNKNIYEKLQEMRVELQQMNIKKSGKNKFAGYEYYELGDILPPINELQDKYKTCSFINFDSEKATLTIINTEKTEEKIEFTCPMTSISLKGAHDVQNMGALQTYNRRYLYMNCFEIVENEYFDSVQGKNESHKNSSTNTTHEAISQETKDNLNKLIQEYSDKSKKEIKDIVKELGAKVGKNISTIDEIEGKSLLQYLHRSVHKNTNSLIIQ